MAAGDIIYASDFEYWVSGTSSNTSSAAIGTSETAVVTVPSATYLAGCAYRLKVTGGLIVSSTTGEAFARVRKTNAGGTQLLEWPRPPLAGSVLAHDMALSERYFIVGGADVTTTLVLTLQATSGSTVTHAGGPYYPRGVDVHFVGPAAKWPNAVVLVP